VVSSEGISMADPILDGNEAKYLVECIRSGWVSSYGSYVSQFETDFAAFCSVREAISCSNGTAALHLALVALGLGPGDEVIVPALTYIATANAVRYCGARPVFADVDEKSMTLDPDDVESKITSRTRAIIPVHLYGQCADMEAILQIAARKELHVVEDAAQAHGATSRGRRAGSMGTVGTFSFFGNKIVTTGEGGMVTLNDPELGERIRLLRNQGSTSTGTYWHTAVGFNYRLTNLQAAVGVAQMERIAEFLDRRAAVAGWYDEELAGIDDVVQRPTTPPGDNRACWTYPISLRSPIGVRRREVMLRLLQDGIETRPVFYPIYSMPPYRERQVRCPIAEDLGARGICLPIHPRLSREQVAFIGARLRFHLEVEVSQLSG
jgi:perosamine synthetase